MVVAGLLVLQAATTGAASQPFDQEPSAPATEVITTDVNPDCPITQGTEIVVCGKPTIRQSYRFQQLPVTDDRIIGDDGRFRLKIGDTTVTGGGPPGKNGQSVGLELRFHF